jgi:exosome complex RNA-binding protein Rrp4
VIAGVFQAWHLYGGLFTIFRGHGTYMEEEKLHASVAGVVERVNKLICVKPLKTRYGK